MFNFLAVYYTKFSPLFDGIKIFLGKSILAYGFVPKNKALFTKILFHIILKEMPFLFKKSMYNVGNIYNFIFLMKKIYISPEKP